MGKWVTGRSDRMFVAVKLVISGNVCVGLVWSVVWFLWSMWLGYVAYRWWLTCLWVWVLQVHCRIWTSG